MKIIIADSSSLIALLDTGNVVLLFELFDEIIITPAVYHEITEKFDHKETYMLSQKLQVQSVAHQELYEMLIKRLDAGEAESITLAKEQRLPLIIDEKKGRSIAKSLGVPIIGLVGIMIKLMEKKIILKARAIEIIDAVEANDFRLSEELKELVYKYE
jgi:predicted nucleic acid-binding protein